MLIIFFSLAIFVCPAILKKHEKSDSDSDKDFGASLISSLKNDANLDLPVDEEYEDLRAELLAYHSALASLVATKNPNDLEKSGRRSMYHTQCWAIGGICVKHELCKGFRFLSEVVGCKNKLNVCCFEWNKFQVKDMREHKINNNAYPWRMREIPFEGEGIKIVDRYPSKKKKKKQAKKKESLREDQNTVDRIAMLLQEIENL